MSGCGQNMLLVDTCGATGLVALASLEPQPAVISERRLPGRETQERLMTAVSDVLSEAGCEVGRVDVLAVVSGPGSFTGVRIGMAAVKGLAEALARPVVVISRLAVLASMGSPAKLASMLDAGRGDVYLGLYESGNCERQVLLPLSAALEQSSGMDVLVCEQRLFAAIPEGRATLVHEPSAEDVLRVAAQVFQSGASADTVLLDANYLRVPDAELALRAAQAKA